MRELIWLIPRIPLLSSVTLMLSSGKFPRLLIGLLGVGSVGSAALLTLALGLNFMANPEVVQLTLWTWMQVGSFAPGVAFYFDEPLFNAQSAATITLFIVTLAVLAESARPLNVTRLALVGLMGATFIAVLYIPWLSNIFALSLGPERYSLISIGVGLAGAVAVVIAPRVTDRWRRAPKGPVEMNAP